MFGTADEGANRLFLRVDFGLRLRECGLSRQLAGGDAALKFRKRDHRLLSWRPETTSMDRFNAWQAEGSKPRAASDARTATPFPTPSGCSMFSLLRRHPAWMPSAIRYN